MGDKKDAENRKREIEKLIKRGEFRLEEPEEKKIGITFKRYADNWLKTTVPATCKRSTACDYEAILRNHVQPVFDKMLMQDITRGKIKNFLLDKINNGLAPDTIKHIRSVISSVMESALDDEVIQSNPALGLKKIFPKKTSTAMILNR